MPTLPITVPNVFANATSNIALSLLDADFLAVSQAINGIGNGSTPLTNVVITGGTLTNTTINNPAISGGSMTGTNLSNVSITGASVLTQNGQCRLVYTSANLITLRPYNGQAIQIAGMIYAVPAAGVSATNGGLAALTPAYVYAYISGGAVALELSPTSHVTDTTAGNIGVEIKSGDPSRTLVGLIYTNASSQFVDAANFRGVASWFNRRNVCAEIANSQITGFSTSGAWVQVSGSIVTTLTWADEGLYITAPCRAASTTIAESVSFMIALNGARIAIQGSAYAPIGQFQTAVAAYAALPGSGEGRYDITLFANTPTTDAKTIDGSIAAIVRI